MLYFIYIHIYGEKKHSKLCPPLVGAHDFSANHGFFHIFRSSLKGIIRSSLHSPSIAPTPGISIDSMPSLLRKSMTLGM